MISKKTMLVMAVLMMALSFTVVINEESEQSDAADAIFVSTPSGSTITSTSVQVGSSVTVYMASTLQLVNDPSAYTVHVGSSSKATASASYYNMHNASVTITGVSAGSTTLYISFEDINGNGPYTSSTLNITVSSATPTTYTVSFAVDSSTKGTVSPTYISSVPSGSSISVSGNTVTINGTTVTATAKSGYTFSSWSNTSGSITANRTITANFTATTTYYNVTVYKGDYASFKWYSGSDSTTYSTSSHTYSVPSGTAFDIDWQAASSSSGSGAGYTYVTSYSGTNYMASSLYGTSLGDSVTITSSGSYYPTPSMNSTASTTYTYNYTIRYNANGGSGAPSNTTSTSTSSTFDSNTSKSITLSSTIPTRTNYNFVGWATSSSANAPSYQPGNTYTFTYGTTDLYAVWQSPTNAGTWTDTDGNTITTLSLSIGESKTVRLIPTYNSTGQDTVLNYSDSSKVSGSISYVNQLRFDVTFTGSSGGSTTTTITYVAIVDGEFYTSSALNITVANPTYTVSIASNNNSFGTVSPASISNVPSGTAVTVSGNTLTINGTTVTATPHAADAGYTYAFSSWSNATAPITSDRTITANFTRTPVTGYSGHWTDTDGNTITTLTVEVGESKTVRMIPDINSTGQDSVLTFSDGSKAGGSISYVNQLRFDVTFTGASTGNTSATLSYVAIPNEETYTSGSLAITVVPATFTVTIDTNNANFGTVSQNTITHITSGTAVTTSGNTLTIGNTTVTATPHAQDGGYTYAFSSWSNATDPVTSNRTITANFTQTPISGYTGHWTDENGNDITNLDLGVGQSKTVRMIPDINSTGQDTVLTLSDNTKASGSVHYVDQLRFDVTFTGLANGTTTAILNYVAIPNEETYTSASLTITVTAPTYTVTLASNNVNFGTVSQDKIMNIPSGTAVTVSGNTLTINGTTVTATPHAQDGGYTYAFSSWSNATDPVTADRTITANFIQTPISDYSGYWTDLDGNTITDLTLGVGETRTVRMIPDINSTGQDTVLTLSDNNKASGSVSYINQLRFDVTFTGLANGTTTATLSYVAIPNEETYTSQPLNVTVIQYGNVWWDNGYFNGSVNVAFNFTNQSNMVHSMIIPLLTYNGIEDNGDGYSEFDMNGYILTITNSYGGNITCSVTKPDNSVQNYTSYLNGHWNQYLLTIDVQKGTISFTGIEADSRNPDGFSFINYTTIFEKTIFDISDNVRNMAIGKIYHGDNGTVDHPHFQVTATTTYLKTYGFVMVDPTINLYDKFPNYDNLRFNVYSFAYYGDGLTINNHHYDMDGSVIDGFWYLPKGSPIYNAQHQITGYTTEDMVSTQGVEGSIELRPTLNNIYITWTNIHSETASERVCYLTFVNDNKTINMGTFAQGDLTVSFDGVWYFTTAIYEPYTGYETVYNMDWDSPFNLDKDAFILVFIAVAALCFLILNIFYKPGILDYIIVAGAGLIAYILL